MVESLFDGGIPDGDDRWGGGTTPGGGVGGAGATTGGGFGAVERFPSGLVAVVFDSISDDGSGGAFAGVNAENILDGAKRNVLRPQTQEVRSHTRQGSQRWVSHY